jgi:hypothetical protein
MARPIRFERTTFAFGGFRAHGHFALKDITNLHKDLIFFLIQHQAQIANFPLSLVDSRIFTSCVHILCTRGPLAEPLR